MTTHWNLRWTNDSTATKRLKEMGNTEIKLEDMKNKREANTENKQDSRRGQRKQSTGSVQAKSNGRFSKSDATTFRSSNHNRPAAPRHTQSKTSRLQTKRKLQTPPERKYASWSEQQLYPAQATAQTGRQRARQWQLRSTERKQPESNLALNTKRLFTISKK